MIVIRIIVFSLIFFTIFPLNHMSAESAKNKVQFEVDPSKLLFNVKDFAAGDWSTKKVTIKNNGLFNLSYKVSSKMTNGSEKLFNSLLLEINVKNKNIYKGYLKNFQGLEKRLLKAHEYEELEIKVILPSSVGNDFQTLKCNVQFSFLAENASDVISPGSGTKLPDTGSNIFNILVSGGGLILIGGIFNLLFSRMEYLKRKSHNQKK